MTGNGIRRRSDRVGAVGPSGPPRRRDRAVTCIIATSNWVGSQPWVLRAIAVAGAFVAAGQVITWSTMGAWPFHDTASSWIAAIHLRDNAPVYGGSVGGFLAELYAPPWAVLYLPASFIPLDVVCAIQLAAQVMALRLLSSDNGNRAAFDFKPERIDQNILFYNRLGGSEVVVF